MLWEPDAVSRFTHGPMANGFSYGVFEGDCTYAETHDAGSASAIAAALNAVVDKKSNIPDPELPGKVDPPNVKVLQANIEKLWDQEITHRRIVRESVTELRGAVDAFLDTRGHCRTADMRAFVDALTKVSVTLLKCADNNEVIETRRAELNEEIRPLLEAHEFAMRSWDRWMIKNDIGRRS